MASFVQAASDSVGSNPATPAPVSVYTVPATKQSVVTGIAATNKTGFNLPVQIWVDKGGADLWIAKDVHLQPGAVTNIEGADKMVLAAGDIVKADARRITADGDAFSIVVSVYEDV